MDKQALLDNLRSEIITQAVCPELAESAQNLIMGEGNPDAQVVFIGEAPGKREDQSGRPFIGASGKFLNEMLAGINLARQDVYITNIVKYRPPDNRDPKTSEKEAFWPYLMAQLEIIKPQLVVTLGRHSLQGFLPGLQISQVHGQVISDGRYSWSILALYHPAAALYNGSLRRTLVDDFQQIETNLGG
ncbi:MAG: uracil-DNA glycosylase [bacterium]|nr:uracil-DNA glycosylase [bacterium]MDN5835231.1 uracil-DNA glycosylase [bacterium]